MTTATAANDAAAACQRLRGHLAYLKLPAALEALPAVLDAARDGTLTALEAIEQLLGTEAEAAQQRKLGSRLRWAALPAPWQLADYDFSAQPGADEKLIRDLATLRFLDDIGNHLYQNLLNAPLRETFAA
jgi:DNA replication protein DnaC